MEQQSFWSKVIKSKYDIRSNGWDSKEALKVTYRDPWKFIGGCHKESILRWMREVRSDSGRTHG